jgi:hypothetical protein
VPPHVRGQNVDAAGREDARQQHVLLSRVSLSALRLGLDGGRAVDGEAAI